MFILGWTRIEQIFEIAIGLQNKIDDSVSQSLTDDFLPDSRFLSWSNAIENNLPQSDKDLQICLLNLF